MGSKPSRVRRDKVVAVEGARSLCAPPAQQQTASAPPTPQHPEGTPRALSPSEEFPALVDNAAVTMSDAWLPGACGTPTSHAAPKAKIFESFDAQQLSPTSEGYPSAEASTPSTSKSPVPKENCALRATASSPSMLPVATEEPLAITRPVPEGDACGSSGEFSLDVPLEEVLKKATEAFGQIATSLSSTKWDRRQQALKGIIAVLKGLDIKVGSNAGGTSLIGEGQHRGLQLRDHSRCFRAACLILHIALRDKVLPVLLAAHELYRVVFEHSRAAVPQVEAFSACDDLLPHLLAKLGDLNIKLHDSACACVLFTAKLPFFGVALVLSRLSDAVEGRGSQKAPALRGQQKMRVHYGVLQAAEQLMRQAPGRRVDEGDEADASSTWTPPDLAPFIISGLQADSVLGGRVQQAALSIATNVYQTLGKAALQSIMEQLTPAAKDILCSRLEEEGEDMEDMDGGDGDEDCFELTGADSLCIMGVGLRPQRELLMSKPITTDREESLMDEILEDTGLVFDGQGLGNCIKKPSYRSSLDEELTGLGFDDIDDELDTLTTAESMTMPSFGHGHGHNKALLI